jgi:hypothetical protein
LKSISKAVVSTVKKVVAVVVKVVKPVVNAVKAAVTTVARAVVNVVKPVVHTVVAASKTVASVASSAASTVAHVQQQVVQSVVQRVQRTVEEIVDACTDKATLCGKLSAVAVDAVKIAAPIVVGMAVTAGCLALTFGAGSLGCLALGGAAGGALSGVIDCPAGQSKLSCGARGAAIGAVTNVLMPVGGSALSGVASKLAPKVGSRVFAQTIEKTALNRAAVDSAESKFALRKALDEGLVRPDAPTNHLNGAMTEQIGWLRSLKSGEIGILKPGKVTANGPDYVTFSPENGRIIVWDAKYSANGKFPHSGEIPSSKLMDWDTAVQDAVNNYTGPSADTIKQAYANGSIHGRYFTYP